MDTTKFNTWVQTISGIALVIGIVLVIIEMNQTKRLTQAGLYSSSWELVMNRGLSFIGEDPMDAWAKACDPKAVMTRKDAMILNNIFATLYYTVSRAREIGQVAGFEDERWIGPANANFPRIFDSQHGRDWWAVFTARGSGPIKAHGDFMLATLGPPTCSQAVEAILTANEQKITQAAR